MYIKKNIKKRHACIKQINVGNCNGTTIENMGGKLRKEKIIESIPIVPLAPLKDANKSFSHTIRSFLSDKERVDIMISTTAILWSANMKEE